MFAPDEIQLWDSGIFISLRTADGFYTDIFQFWVRALFCFCENTSSKLSFRTITPSIDCRPIPPQEFKQYLLSLVQTHIPNMQGEIDLSPISIAQLQKRTYSQTYLIGNNHGVETGVCESDWVYLAYFHQRKDRIPAKHG